MKLLTRRTAESDTIAELLGIIDDQTLILEESEVKIDELQTRMDVADEYFNEIQEDFRNTARFLLECLKNPLQTSKIDIYRHIAVLLGYEGNIVNETTDTLIAKLQSDLRLIDVPVEIQAEGLCKLKREGSIFEGAYDYDLESDLNQLTGDE